MHIETPLSEDVIKNLNSGDQVELSGTIYTARDAAHAKLIELIEKDKDLPIPLKGQAIYYVGPAPAKPGKVIGSAGPTTSYRMDSFTPRLLENGLKATIGKGPRSAKVKDAMIKNKAVYLGAVGGAAALISKHITEAEIIAYPELGPEAIRRLKVESLPLFVINDIYGGDLYQDGVKKYKQE